jgi:phosphoribosyl-dephospho-CoA transferase
MMTTPRRHSLVWLTPAGWQLAQQREPGAAEHLAEWQRGGRPLVARRRDADAPADEICLGLPLPPHATLGKRRIALRLPASAVDRIEEALALGAILPGAPASWSAPLARLEHEATAAGIALRVYGSAAWQVLTGLDYLTETSDIDLLFAPDSAEALRHGLALLAAHAGALPIDGEILFPSGRAVSWKEWLLADASAAGVRVLVKHESGVALEPASALLAELPVRVAR